MIYGTAAAVVAMLGGSITLSLPVDEKVKTLETQLAQNWQQQQQYHHDRELEQVEWQMRYISNEINRISQIPNYLKRPLTQEEQWSLEQLKREWGLLQERRAKLSGR